MAHSIAGGVDDRPEADRRAEGATSIETTGDELKERRPGGTCGSGA
jgi:hypothetical protein